MPTFTPISITLTDSIRSGTFTLTTDNYGSYIIQAFNNQLLVNPGTLPYFSNSGSLLSISITSHTNGVNLWGSVGISASVTGGSAKRVDFLVDNQTWVSDPTSPYLGYINTDMYGDGVHTIKARAFDVFGNYAETSITGSFNNTTMPTGAVSIPATSGTVTLSIPNTYYYLTGNIVSRDIGVAVAAENVTLDLNGFTIIYDQDSPVVVVNNGFETGNASGWDISNAPTFSVVPASIGMYDKYMGKFTNTLSSGYIVSSPIILPRSAVPYVYGVQAGATNSGNVTISVIDAVTSGVYSSFTQPTNTVGNNGMVSNNQSAALGFVPNGSQLNVKLMCSVGPSITSNPATGVDVIVDYFSLDKTALSLANTPVIGGVAVTVFNKNALRIISSKPSGAIIQGSARSSWAHMINNHNPAVANLEVNNVSGYFWGWDANGIDHGSVTTCIVQNCDIRGNVDRQTDRQNWRGFIILNGNVTASLPSGRTIVDNNRLIGGSHNGIAITNRLMLGSQITNNIISQTSRWVDGYSIQLNCVASPVVTGNFCYPVSGRGFMTQTSNPGGSITDADIHDNTFIVQESGTAEFGQVQTAIAWRWRSYTGTGLLRSKVYNNNFIAYTGQSGYDQYCSAARISYISIGDAMDNAQTVVYNNLFRGILTGQDPNITNGQDAFALSLGEYDTTLGPGCIFIGNTLDSNGISLEFNNNDGANTYNAWFINNTFTKSPSGLQVYHSNYTLSTGSTYLPIAAAYTLGVTQDARLIDNIYGSGVSFSLFLAGTPAKQISTGYLLNVTAQSGGLPINKSMILAYDSARNLSYSGYTDNTGRINLNPYQALYGIPLGVTFYTSNGSTGQNNSPIVSGANPFTIYGYFNNISGSTTISISGDQSLTLNLN